MVTTKTLQFDSTVIDILKNDTLSKRPFLIRFSDYNFPFHHEIRFSKEDMLLLSQSLLNMVQNER